jgi:hypothetical protein
LLIPVALVPVRVLPGVQTRYITKPAAGAEETAKERIKREDAFRDIGFGKVRVGRSPLKPCPKASGLRSENGIQPLGSASSV